MTGGGATPGAGQVRFLRFDPQGLPVDTNASTNCYNPDAGAGCAGGTPHQPHRRSTRCPASGSSWSRRAAPPTSLQAPFGLTATVLGAAISPNPDVVPSATLGTPQIRNYTVANQLRRVHRPPRGRRLAGEHADAAAHDRAPGPVRPSTSPCRPASRNYTIRTGNSIRPAGRHRPVRVPMRDRNLHPGGSGTSASRRRAGIDQQPGRRPVADRRRRLHACRRARRRRPDRLVRLRRRSGSLTSADADADHPSGSSWSPTATLTVNGQPGAGRKITGTLRVQTERRASPSAPARWWSTR